MNQNTMSQETIHSPPPAPAPTFWRFRSISTTVLGGLILTGTLFAAVSIIAILGFMNFQKVLTNLSSQSFPRATHEAQISILLSQLLQQIDDLHIARTHPEQRLAYDKIQQQFIRIDEFSASFKQAYSGKESPAIDNLSKILFELNDLVSERIDVRLKILQGTANLLPLVQSMLATKHTVDTIDGSQSYSAVIDRIAQQAIAVTHQSNQAVWQQVLQQINEDEDSIARNLTKMTADVQTLPPNVQSSTATLVANLREEILGEQGVLPLAKDLQRIRNECALRNTEARSLVHEKEEASIAGFFHITSSVGIETHLLTKKVGHLLTILSALFVISFLMAITFFVYFRHVLIARLLLLNRTVLAMVAGKKPTIAIKGADEISEIARSVQYFSDEMHTAKELAEKSAVAKADFLAHMSHEIRTPMNAILGFSDLALRSSNPEEHLDYLGKINNASYSLLGIINSVLDYSKIEAGKFTIENAPFDLRELLENLSTLIDLRCEESGLEFYFHIEPETPYALKGDALRLGQVLTNLITNAFKFTESGCISVHIRTLPEERPATDTRIRLYFAVQDTGTGITREQAEILFQPFTQADISITRRFGGTGLGLAICKNLVEMMGGEIRMEQGENNGSTFSFSLPFESQNDPAGHFFAAPGSITGKKAIVMSDIPQTATELSCMLTNFGLTVFQTLSLDDVISALESQDRSSPYDLVVIDYRTHGLRFPELLRKIKLSNQDDDKPALILTGIRRLAPNFSKKSLPECDHFLAKPITPARLLHALLTAFKLENQDPLPSANGISLLKNCADHEHLAGARILLVEDNEINQQVAAGFLHSLGLSVVVAWNGAEALEILRRPQPLGFDLILMDLQMPVMDGYSTTRAIRQLEAPTGTLPIVAITAHALPGEREKCIAEGMDDYLTKPINLEALFAILTRTIVRYSTLEMVQSPDPASLPGGFLGIHAGIDMQAGIARVVGDANLYMDLLRTFFATYRTYPSSINDALKSRSVDTLLRMAHTLKGVSGNLEMPRLFSLSAQLEQAARKKKLQECSTLLVDVERETDKICDFLSQYLDNDTNSLSNTKRPDQQKATDTSVRHSLLADLSASLCNNSAKALQQIQTLQAHLDPEEGLVFSQIEKHINNLDFAKAQHLLHQWQDSERGKRDPH